MTKIEKNYSGRIKNRLFKNGTGILYLFLLVFTLGVMTSCDPEEDNSEPEEETELTVSFTLTDTGQDVFYDAEGNVIDTPIEGEDYYGQDAQYIGTSSSFKDNGDGTVTDMATGLMWQQVDDGNEYDWIDALALASESEFAGYTDWRLPNTKELQSIVDYDKTTIPVIDETYFSCTNSDSWFWTSTTQGDFKYTGCYIAFGKAYSRENSNATVL